MRVIEGVSGAVYRVEDLPLPGASTRARLFRCRDERGVTRLYKEYLEPVGGKSEHAAASAQLCAAGRELVANAEREKNVGGAPASSVAWPLDFSPAPHDRVSGVVIQPAPYSFYADDGTLRTLDRLARPWPDAVVTSDRIGTLIRLCEVLSHLECRGLIHGAVAAEHVAWRGGAAGVYLISCDRLHPAGSAAPAPRAAASAWRDPRLTAGQIDIPDGYSDRYGLALALYSGLFLNTLPPDYRPGGVWAEPSGFPEGLAPRLRELFSQALADPFAADARPDATQWLETLVEVYRAGEGYRLDQVAQLDQYVQRRKRGASEQPSLAATTAAAPPARTAPAPIAPPRPVPPPPSGSATATAPAPRSTPAPPTPAAAIGHTAPPHGRVVPPWPTPARPGTPTRSLADRRRTRRAWMVGAALVGAIMLISIALAVRPSTSTAAPPYTNYPPGYGQGNPAAGDSTDPTATDTAAADASPGDTSTDGGDTTTATPSPSGTGDGATEAQAISNLITQSAQDRNLVANAVETELGGCQNLSQGVSDLNQAAADRGQEFQMAQQLAVDALSNGDQLKQDLLDALSASQQADEAFARWGSSLDPNTCVVPAPQDSDFAAGGNASQQATTAKTQFIALWQAVAAQYGLTVPDQSTI
jgi:hypothetical protein